MQHGGASVIDPQSCRAVVIQCMQPHEPAIRFLTQRVFPQESFGITNRVVIITLVFEQQNQSLQCLNEFLLQAFAFRKNPIVVAARQEFAMIEIDRFAQR